MNVGQVNTRPITGRRLLQRLIEVDGVGSGLDADLVRGVTPGVVGLAALAAGTQAAGRTALGFTDAILDRSSPGAIGATTPAAGNFTALGLTGDIDLNGNDLLYGGAAYVTTLNATGINVQSTTTASGIVNLYDSAGRHLQIASPQAATGSAIVGTVTNHSLLLQAGGVTGITITEITGKVTLSGDLDLNGHDLLDGGEMHVSGIYQKDIISAIVLSGGTDLTSANTVIYGKNHPTLANRAYHDAALHTFRSVTGATMASISGTSFSLSVDLDLNGNTIDSGTALPASFADLAAVRAFLATAFN